MPILWDAPSEAVSWEARQVRGVSVGPEVWTESRGVYGRAQSPTRAEAGMSEHMETTEPGDGAMVIALAVLALVFFVGVAVGWLL